MSQRVTAATGAWGHRVQPRKGHYEESIALEPWDYGGPEHCNHAPYVVIVDSDEVLLDVEHGLEGILAVGQRFPGTAAAGGLPPPTALSISFHAPRRALFVRPPAAEDRCIARVNALGNTTLEDDASSRQWLGRRPGSLLKFLVCRRYGTVRTQEIAEALWGHAGFVSSGTVRQCVHELRAKLERSCADEATRLVETDSSGYALSRAVAVDADDFAVHVRRGIAAAESGHHEIGIVHLRRAVSMYRGDFLADEPTAEWTVAERERLREHMEDALSALADLYVEQANLVAATLCLRRLAQMRPLDGDVHQRLIVVLISQGHHSHAARCYEMFSARLWSTFLKTPGFALTDLDSDLPPIPGASAGSRH